MDLEGEVLYYPSSENKGADQLLGNREADLRLCFHICKMLVSHDCGSLVNLSFRFKKVNITDTIVFGRRKSNVRIFLLCLDSMFSN